MPAGRARVQAVVLSAGTASPTSSLCWFFNLTPNSTLARCVDLAVKRRRARPRLQQRRLRVAQQAVVDRRAAANIQGEKRTSREPLAAPLLRNASDPTAVPGAGVVPSVGGQPGGRPRSPGPGENPPVQHAVPGQQHLLCLRAAAALVAQRALRGREDEGVGRR